MDGFGRVLNELTGSGQTGRTDSQFHAGSRLVLNKVEAHMSCLRILFSSHFHVPGVSVSVKRLRCQHGFHRFEVCVKFEISAVLVGAEIFEVLVWLSNV
jgi:hypothetical protein